ncbi:hypothetical protein DIPPA_35858 [Diplonema papillatum]|nr:hypothetical protein DIPPA_35858 [Diplonema papillatum]
MFRRTCAQQCSALEVSGVVTNFAGRYPRVKLDDGSYVVVRDSTKFIMRDRRLSLSKDTAEADWQIRDVQKSSGTGSDGPSKGFGTTTSMPTESKSKITTPQEFPWCIKKIALPVPAFPREDLILAAKLHGQRILPEHYTKKSHTTTRV